MATETSPLIRNEELEATIHDHEAIYDRFPVHKKRMIVALVSWSALLPMFASGTFIPSMPQIAHDLDSTPEIISLAVSLSIFSTALGALVYAPYSIYYGRRIAYLTGSPLLCLGSIGVCLSRTVPELLVWRCIQAMGTSGGMAIGASVIGDIYKLTERGRAMGIFFGASLVGPALSPLAVAGLLTFLLLFTFLPETSHPGSRGIDKYRAKLGDSNGFEWVWLNPFASLAILRSPNILIVTLAGTCSLVTDFFLMIPIAFTIGVRYNITNELVIGACFIPVGLGNMIGAPLAGFLADRVVIRSIEKHGPSVWRPEERLKAALFGALVPVPLSILLSGLITKYIPGPLGLSLNLICFFMNGIGVDLVLTPLCAYVVDIMRERSAEVLAATISFRSMLLAAALTLAIPSIKLIGVAATDAILAAVAWLAFGAILLVIHNGQAMRDWIDVGYTKVEDA
ncbi:MFS general substrate transporter [Hymenopellis radicata]|nr:MFS general substrate transporter [Hymenopellis radicata]